MSLPRDFQLQPPRPSWGIRAPTRKQESTTRGIIPAPPPAEAVISLRQCAGRTAVPCVETGQRVAAGEPVASTPGSGDTLIHASVSGVVAAIEERLVFSRDSSTEPCIVIRSDGLDRPFPGYQPVADPLALDPATVRNRIAEAGIVGLGGALFPAVRKLAAAGPIHALILNGVECEPYISCDEVLLRYHAKHVLQGARILMHAAGTEQCVVVIETDMPEARVALHEALESLHDDRIAIAQVTAKYPSGGERQVLELVAGVEVPSGSRPQDIGYVCQNVGTAAAVADFFAAGRPVISRIVTVTGYGVARPVNIEARIGTPVADLVDIAGGYRGEPGRLIAGGPMMGFALPSDTIPISKASNCIVVATDRELARPGPEMPCIRCAECLRACPARLLPQELLSACRQKDMDALDALGLPDCIECGCCDYVCPSHIPLTARFSLAKIGFMQQRSEQRRAARARARFEAREARLAERAARRAEALNRQIAGLAPVDNSSPDDASADPIGALMKRVTEHKRDQEQ